MSEVVAIYTAPAEGALTVSREEVDAVAGVGLEGDRYASGDGTFSTRPKPGREVTLIEIEAVEAARRDHDVPIEAGETRRNIVTRGVALNHLVDREFQVGDVVLRGVKLCEPCRYLEGLTHEGVREALIHRGGLNAQIVRGGTIHVGDPVRT
ncbi:MAG: MOSC domain-containing protein [Actinobacteria bacterium]|nr:MOSC domain-containing protein [Actinomycetota bacterium]